MKSTRVYPGNIFFVVEYDKEVVANFSRSDDISRRNVSTFYCHSFNNKITTADKNLNKYYISVRGGGISVQEGLCPGGRPPSPCQQND